jgi:hypothetical protein
MAEATVLAERFRTRDVERESLAMVRGAVPTTSSPSWRSPVATRA